MPDTPKEATISAAIVKFLRSLPQAHAHKVHGGPYGHVGEPDIDACVSGRSVKIEVKRPDRPATLTPNQKKALETWRRAGAIAFVATSVEQVRLTLQSEGLIDATEASDSREHHGQ